MKKKINLIGKLKLNKESVSFLSNEEMTVIRGGATEAGICDVTMIVGCITGPDNCMTEQCDTADCGPNATSYQEGHSNGRFCWHLQQTVWWCNVDSCYCTIGHCNPN